MARIDATWHEWVKKAFLFLSTAMYPCNYMWMVFRVYDNIIIPQYSIPYTTAS